MGADAKIQWTHHTFNPWWGCTKVSPGCNNCYAEAFDHRLGGKHWGKGAERRVFGEKHWSEPRKWDRAAREVGERHRVFCASMADWADAEAPEGQRERLWALIRETPNLDWLLLTKRHARIRACLPPDWGGGYPNVWLGVSVDDKAHGLPRIDVLRAVPARVRFLSVEPLLEGLGQIDLSGIHWVIIGGESGHGARAFHLSWARSIIQHARAAGTAIFMKQLGGGAVRGDTASDHRYPHNFGTFYGDNLRLVIRDPKGGDWAEWPEDLRVREFPTFTR
jgi:protein gp37